MSRSRTPGAGAVSLTMSTVETAHSTLFFVSDRVYKMPKRAVVGTSDLRHRKAREQACRAEVVRNRPFAPGVYLGVADVRDGDGVPVDHMVVMRRLPRERRLSELLVRGEPVEQPLRETARALVTCHERCETSAGIAGHGRMGEVEALWLAALDGILPSRGTELDADVVDEIDRLAQRYLRGRQKLIDGRAAGGHIRDGHGNLVAEHVFCLPEGPRVLGRLPVDDGRRLADVLADAAMLAVDLELRGVPELGRRFLHWCAEFAGESHPPSLAHFYLAYRAVVLAGEAMARSRVGDEAAADGARRLTRIALEHLRQARVRLVLVGGAPGTVRAALAERLVADQDGWMLLSSDTVRGELAVDRERASDPAGEFGSDEAVYAEMLRRAREALQNGDSVVAEARWPAAAAPAAAAPGGAAPAHSMLAAAAAVADETWADLVEVDCSGATASFGPVVREARRASGITN